MASDDDKVIGHFDKLIGKVAGIDRHGYGTIELVGGKPVFFKMSQVKTPAGVSVGSVSLSQNLLGQQVEVSGNVIDEVRVADAVVVLGDVKWRDVLG